MRFALFGNHPDGLDMARALVESGRHELVAVAGLARGNEVLASRGLTARLVGDIEELLADPTVEAVIVAGAPSVRVAQLRRALQSERHVLCVHPIDPMPDPAYEAAMIQRDTRRVLLPLLTEFLHPGVARLTDMIQTEDGPLGTFQLVELERWGPPGMVWAGDRTEDFKATLPGWDVLRTLRGEVAEVFGFAADEAAAPDGPLLVAGRFERGGLFRATFYPNHHDTRWRLTALGSRGKVELAFPNGWPGMARLNWRDETGNPREETWADWNPWPVLVPIVEAVVADWARRAAPTGEALTIPKTSASRQPAAAGQRLSWHDEIRCLELDDTARRSVERRRASTLEYQEANEEVGFKGTMTLVGCGMLWGMILLVILSRWYPRLGWLIIPLLIAFLGLQLLRWVIPKAPEKEL